MAAYAFPGIFVMGCLVYLMESYVIRCPEQSEWNIRAEIQCKNITKYFCLYNSVNYTYEEGCTGPEWDILGSKRVYSLNFDTAPCRDTRYQPIRFVTNGNSDCIFRKSLCTEEGQTLVSNGTTKTDSTCRCDYTQGYAFVTVPRSKCYCRPSEEDCSCYLKKCQGIGYNLSADYECTKDITNNTDCPSISANPYEDPHIDMVPRKDDLYVIKRTCGVAILVSICFFVMIVITICTLFHQRLPRCPNLSTNQYVIRLEERVWGSKNIQGVLMASDKKWKSALDELKDNIEKDGLDTALYRLNEDLDNWKNEPVKLAVTGKSGVGKSSFINAIRNMKPGDPDFATVSSTGNTTKHVTVYEYPGNPKITLHDLPGFGSIELPINGYEKTMELHQYDYILIFVGNIEENDIEIAKRVKEMRKPFCFVRSKIDIDILNAEKDGELEIYIVEKIRSKSSDNIKRAGFNKAKFFVISNHNPRIYQFNDLVSYIQSNLPALKCDAVVFSLFGELTDDIINNKYKLLKDRLFKVSVASIGLDTAPVSDMDKECNKALICKELLLYHKAFAFEQQTVKDSLQESYIRQKLSANSIIEIQASEAKMCEFVIIELEKCKTSEAREIPSLRFDGPEVIVRPDCAAPFRLLNQVLDGCRDDAKLVYSHLINVNAEE